MTTQVLTSTALPSQALEASQDGTCAAIRLQGAASPHIEIPPGKVLVRIPDMFNSIMAVAPKVNPLYEEVKFEAEEWIAKKLNAGDRMKNILSKTDFAWFCAVAVPDAGKEELRTLCDWGNWVFPFDDIFDNGKLKDDPNAASKVMEDLLLIMRGGIREGEVPAFIEIHDTVWERVTKTSTQAVQIRFLSAMTEYCDGARDHVGHQSKARCPNLSEYIEVRRRGVGVTPVIALMEYALRLQVSDHVYEHESFGKLKRIVIDVILIQNDIISYKKEEAEGVPHNLITVLRCGGMTTQEAFNHAGEMLNGCYQEWLDVTTEFPEGQDVRGYIEGTRNIMLASLHWHFRSDRYFGEMKDFVRQHRIIFVNRDDHMLQSKGMELAVSGFQSWVITFWKRFGAVLSYIRR